MALAMLFFVLVFVVVFGMVLVGVSAALGPKLEGPEAQKEPYECGVVGQGNINARAHVGFYLTAILFILFDIEIIFMYPWAAVFMDFVRQGHGLYMLGVMGFFVLIFAFGLLWEIKSKALTWD